MKIILKYFKWGVVSFPRLFLISMTWIMLYSLVDVIIPLSIRLFLEIVSKKYTNFTLMLGLFIFGILLFLKIITKIMWYLSIDDFAGKYIEQLSLNVEESMVNAIYEKIEEKKPEVIRNILYTDILNVFRVVGHHIPSAIGSMVVIILALIISFSYEIKITLFICFAILFGVILSYASRKILSKVAGATNVKLKIHDASCTEFVALLPLIQCNNILSYFKNKTSANLSEFISTSKEEDKKTIFWSGLIKAYHSLFTIMLSVLLTIPLLNYSISTLVFFTTIANLILDQTQNVELLFQLIIKNHISFKHVDELVYISKREGFKQISKVQSVIFENVGYVYRNGISALNDVCCKFQQGSVIRLIGPNGSGKSTFLKLLTGQYSPTNGKIYINDINISEILRTDLNKNILYVGQDEKLLNETFKNYLGIITGRDITNNQLQELCQWLELPVDNRKIEDNGLSLSVGQRKKLLIIKLLIQLEEKSLIILDEITAGLDQETTQKVYRIIKEIAFQKSKIVFIVDHNLEDDVFVTDKIYFKKDLCEHRHI